MAQASRVSPARGRFRELDKVTIFEKSRGTGGRCATRRTAHGTFDHGAPYAAAWTARFKAMVAAESILGFVSDWPEESAIQGASINVGVPGMNMFARSLAKGVDLKLSTRIAALHSHDGHWRLVDDAGLEHGPFDKLCLAIPAPQAAALLGDHPFADRLSDVAMDPCWTLMIACDHQLDLLADDRGLDIERIIADHDKPQRSSLPACFTIHMTPRFSRDHLEFDNEAIVELLLGRLEMHLGLERVSVLHAEAQRWRYALVSRPLGEPCLWDVESKLGLCGDWLLGREVENAFLSGAALADRMLELVAA